MFTQHSRKNRRAFTLTAIVAAGLLATACSGVVADPDNGDSAGDGGEPEVELTLVTAAIDGTPNAAVQDWFLDEVEERSDGAIAFERTEAYSLCAAPEIVECVRDGRADIGVTIPDYTPQYFPTTSVVSIPFIGQNWQAIMQSLYDLHQENPDAEAVMEGNGLHYLATWPVGRLLLGTHEPVTDVAGLDGLSVRVSGPLAQELFEGAGASIVALPANETYEGVERGLADAVAAGMDFPVNYKLNELLEYWTDPGFGQYSAFGMWLSNSAYDELTDEQKAVFDEVAEELNAGAGAEAYNETAAAQCPQMLESSTVEDLTAWDESATAAWEEETGDRMLESWVELASGQGLENAQGVLDDYLEGLDTYSGVEVEDATLECVAAFADR
ncbi:TRAP transporter substrate-binding protein DctP [Microbacterium sp. LRZ72]|uniref:TRAP transporter substrate-binding protein DctP n=1 Tax=Microbacterium sp. LRZ72 TaxID=2942481 RepID=UPI0029B2F732|nr:TRAP transporter substrate-binding protein DctP [Microbacterium sp. LRZ72]MDX2376353.1 TRAP transporter substrate-binding protein DctP [Microbacterium sp. LRZ72]